jgi:hypothetical protein
MIAAELVFGVSSGKGGLGWYIFENRNELYTDRVFAGLVMLILIGLVVKSVLPHPGAPDRATLGHATLNLADHSRRIPRLTLALAKVVPFFGEHL